MSPTLLRNGVALRMEEKAIWRALATSLEMKSNPQRINQLKSVVFVLFCVLVVGCGGDGDGDGGQAVIMMVMYAYAVFVVMFYKDDDFKPAGLWFTALYADVIRPKRSRIERTDKSLTLLLVDSAAVIISATVTVFPYDYFSSVSRVECERQQTANPFFQNLILRWTWMEEQERRNVNCRHNTSC
ncbi:hypothetical protein NC652_022984 [Populus alba x Populus x berolinensis]|nr:hypothetical protein NC652_022984 [Populus alba x Populus x berolinensis]